MVQDVPNKGNTRFNPDSRPKSHFYDMLHPSIPCLTYRCPFLLLLGTAAASLLSGLDSLLVALDGAASLLHGAHEALCLLERSLEVARGGMAEDMDFEEVALDDGLDGDDALDNQGIGVLHVKVHERHHGDTHQLATPGLAKLVEVVGADRGGDELALFGRAHRCGFNVLEGGHV